MATHDHSRRLALSVVSSSSCSRRYEEVSPFRFSSFVAAGPASSKTIPAPPAPPRDAHLPYAPLLIHSFLITPIAAAPLDREREGDIFTAFRIANLEHA